MSYIIRYPISFTSNYFSLEKQTSGGVESFTISTINFSIYGSNKRFFEKL